MTYHKSLLILSKNMQRLAFASLSQAQSNLFFRDVWLWNERELLTPILTAHAGEMLLKSLVARKDPLRLFRNLNKLGDFRTDQIDLNLLLEKGSTCSLAALPDLLLSVTGIQLPDLSSFEELRELRNQVQHFMLPNAVNAERVCKEFIYKNLDPLMSQEFGECACQFHHDEFDDYLVASIIRHELKFSIPADLEISEVDLSEELSHTSPEYNAWFCAELAALQLSNLIKS